MDIEQEWIYMCDDIASTLSDFRVKLDKHLKTQSLRKSEDYKLMSKKDLILQGIVPKQDKVN